MKSKYLTIFLLLNIPFNFSSFSQNTEPKGMAYAATWQNKAGLWFAIGPVQNGIIGEKTEKEALSYVVEENRDGYKLKFYKKCNQGKIYIYQLGYEYKVGDINTIAYLRKYNGIVCDVPTHEDYFIKKKQENLFQEANELLAREYLSSAIRKYNEIIEIDNTTALATRAYEQLAFIEDLKKLERIDEEYSELMSEAEYQKSLNNLGQASKYYKQASKLKPKESEPKQQLAKIDEENKNAELLEVKYNNYIEYGKLSFARGNLKDAYNFFQKASELKPGEDFPKEQREMIENSWAEGAKFEQEKRELKEKQERTEIQYKIEQEQRETERIEQEKLEKERLKQEQIEKTIQRIDEINNYYDEQRRLIKQEINNLSNYINDQITSHQQAKIKQEKRNQIYKELTTISSDIKNPQELINAYNNQIRKLNEELERQYQEDRKDIDQHYKNVNSELKANSQSELENSMADLMTNTFSAIDRRGTSKDYENKIRQAENKLDKELEQKMNTLKDEYVGMHKKALNDYSAAKINALLIENEEFYSERVEYHKCIIDYINNNFDYKNSNWLNSTCSVSKNKPVANNIVLSSSEYLEAAKRKYVLFQKTADVSYLDVSLKFTNSALAKNNLNHEAYAHRAKVSNNSIDQLSDIRTALYIHNCKEYKDFERVYLKNFNRDFFSSIDDDNLEFIKKAIQNNFHHEVATIIEGEKYSPYEYCICKDKSKALSILLNGLGKLSTAFVQNLFDLTIFYNSPGCFDILISKGASINSEHLGVRTYLTLAAEKSSDKIIPLLVNNSNELTKTIEYYKKHPGLESHDFFYSIAIQYAIFWHKIEIAERLITNNENLHSYILKDLPYNKPDMSAMNYAMERNAAKIILSFIENGASVDITDNEGNTLLHNALLKENQLLTDKLIINNNLINVKNKKGWTPLHIAIWKGNNSTTDKLLKLGAGVNAIGEKGWTPLHFAARENDIEITKLLLKNGAKKNIKDEYGRKPKDVAKEYGFKNIKKYL